MDVICTKMHGFSQEMYVIEWHMCISHSVAFAGDASTGAAHLALHGIQLDRCVRLGTDARHRAVPGTVAEVVAAMVVRPSVGS